MEDNVMPVAYVPTEPKEAIIAKKKEKAHTLQALPILKEVILSFNMSIAELNSVKTMPDDVKKDPKKFMNMHNARELAIDILQDIKLDIESKIDDHAKNL